jgi:hypothetical protein
VEGSAANGVGRVHISALNGGDSAVVSGPTRETVLPIRLTLAAGLLLMVVAQPAAAQRAAIQPDSARAQIRAVLRAFYLNLESQNWDALSGYVLSPKLLERRGAPGDLQTAARERARGRGSSHATSASMTCPSTTSPSVEEARIRLDGDWAEVSVPRCSGASSGTDEFRMLYFEARWRFIYTDLFEAPSPSGR